MAARASSNIVALAPAPLDSAAEAGLRYVTDAGPGIRRVANARGFRYVAPDGRRLTDAGELARIRSLAIPPAWRDVWISPDARGHLQATGRDARGRKQYRYHAKYRAHRDEAKYARVLAFGEALPRIRAGVERDLSRPGLPREKVLAAIVRLLETTLLRVGNAEYARANRSFGLTTMTNDHAEVDGPEVRLRFRGKGGKLAEGRLSDARVARVVRACQDLPGQELFAYVDESGEVRDVRSEDVNAYLAEVSGHDFTAKDFRTWAGTVLCALALAEFPDAGSATASKRNVVAAVKSVAKELGNTPAICRRCYVHPQVIDSYLEGSLVPALRDRVARVAVTEGPALTRDERRVLRFLDERLRQEEIQDRARRARRPARSRPRATMRRGPPRRPTASKRATTRRG